jgi:hypothetical protein
MFFDQAQAQVECMQTVAPAQCLANMTTSILFMNGSEDYRDSEDKWLEICNKNYKTNHDTTPTPVPSELKVCEGGDHFFLHDSRFVNDILESIHMPLPRKLARRRTTVIMNRGSLFTIFSSVSRAESRDARCAL